MCKPTSRDQSEVCGSFDLKQTHSKQKPANQHNYYHLNKELWHKQGGNFNSVIEERRESEALL